MDFAQPWRALNVAGRWTTGLETCKALQSPTSVLLGRSQKPVWMPLGSCAIWHRCAAQARAGAGHMKQTWDGVMPSRAERGLGFLPKAAQVLEGPEQHRPVLVTLPSLLPLLRCGQGRGWAKLPASSLRRSGCLMESPVCLNHTCLLRVCPSECPAPGRRSRHPRVPENTHLLRCVF